MAGYSGTPLPQKLGIKSGMRVIAMSVPENYRALLGKLPDDVEFSNRPHVGAQFIHFFAKRRSDLEKTVAASAKNTCGRRNALGVSWPKSLARMESDVTEDVIRAVALPLGLVDVKVCAVDETWSGLEHDSKRIKTKTMKQRRFDHIDFRRAYDRATAKNFTRKHFAPRSGIYA